MLRVSFPVTSLDSIWNSSIRDVMSVSSAVCQFTGDGEISDASPGVTSGKGGWEAGDGFMDRQDDLTKASGSTADDQPDEESSSQSGEHAFSRIFTDVFLGSCLEFFGFYAGILPLA